MRRSLELIPNPDSPLRRCDPRWKLAAAVVAVGAAAALQTVPAAAAALAGAAALALFARVPPGWYLTRLGFIAPFLALCVLLLPFLVPDAEPLGRLGPLSVSARGLWLAALVCLKAVAILTLVWAVLVSTPLPALLHAARALGVPGVLVHVTLLTYRYVFLLTDELARIRVALRVRGYRNRPALHSYRTVAHVTGTVLVRGHERGERVGQAMRFRGFGGRFRSLVEFSTTAADVFLFVAVTAAAGALVAWDLWTRHAA